MQQQLEQHRERWAKIARANGWYTTPFYIQAWIDPAGNITDSVSFRGMQQDIIVREDEEAEE